MNLSKCKLCDAPFVFKGNGVYGATCEHQHIATCAVCGEGRVHHVGSAKACHGGMGTVFCLVTDPSTNCFGAGVFGLDSQCRKCGGTGNAT